jgi:hypothetical protein
MLMQTKPQVSLDPKGRDPMKLSPQLQLAAERARKDQPRMSALASRVDEYRMLWRG